MNTAHLMLQRTRAWCTNVLRRNIFVSNQAFYCSFKRIRFDTYCHGSTHVERKTINPTFRNTNGTTIQRLFRNRNKMKIMFYSADPGHLKSLKTPIGMKNKKTKIWSIKVNYPSRILRRRRCDSNIMTFKANCVLKHL